MLYRPPQHPVVTLLAPGMQRNLLELTANCANLVGTRNHPHGIDETINDRLADSLAMGDQPRAKRRSSFSGLDPLLQHCQVLSYLQRRLAVVEELNVDRIALEDIRNVYVEAVLGVDVGQQSSVDELPAED